MNNDILTDLKTLRERTGVSVMQCKQALAEAGGDMEKAIVILNKRRSEAAEKKSDRKLAAGAIGSYVHNTGEVAALVLLACETDFVAKNREFAALARDIAMQVAASNPLYLSREHVPQDILDRARAVFEKEVMDKPADKREKILEGKLAAYFKDQILLEQSFIKDTDTTIEAMVMGAVQKFGENIRIADFKRVAVK
jgi:elongation factor Ts